MRARQIILLKLLLFFHFSENPGKYSKISPKMSNIIELKVIFTGCLFDKRMNKMRKIFHCFIKRKTIELFHTQSTL